MLCDILLAGKPKLELGDYNAKIGKEMMYKPTNKSKNLHKVSNDYGNRLTFATTRNMIIVARTCLTRIYINKHGSLHVK